MRDRERLRNDVIAHLSPMDFQLYHSDWILFGTSVLRYTEGPDGEVVEAWRVSPADWGAVCA